MRQVIVETGGAVVLCSMTTTLGYLSLTLSMNQAIVDLRPGSGGRRGRLHPGGGAGPARRRSLWLAPKKRCGQGVQPPSRRDISKLMVALASPMANLTPRRAAASSQSRRPALASGDAYAELLSQTRGSPPRAAASAR